MQFEFTGAELKSLKTEFGKVVGDAQSPIFNHLRFVFDDKGVTATGAGRDERLTWRGEQTGNADFLFPWEAFKNLARRLSPTARIVWKHDGETVQVSGGDVEPTRVLCGPLSQWRLDDPQKAKVTIDSRRLCEVVQDVAPAVGERSGFPGICIDAEGSTAAATDGRRLMRLPFEWAFDRTLLLPCTRMLKSNTLRRDKALAAADDEWLVVQAGSWTYQVRLLTGTFPDCSQTIPKLRAQPTVSLSDEAAVQLRRQVRSHGWPEFIVYADKAQAKLLARRDGRLWPTGIEIQSDAKRPTAAGFGAGFLLDAIKADFRTLRICGSDKATALTRPDGGICLLAPLAGCDCADIAKALATLPELPAPPARPAKRRARKAEPSARDAFLGYLSEARSALRLADAALDAVEQSAQAYAASVEEDARAQGEKLKEIRELQARLLEVAES